MKFFICSLLFVFVSCQPGFKTVISQGGLDYLKGIGLEILKIQLAHLDIRDISGKTNILLQTLFN
jgi:hypothetical protein